MIGFAAQRRLGAILAATLAVVCAEAASAGLYRCVRPDGRTVYTDSQTTCPGAQQHSLSVEVQNYRDDSPASHTPPRVTRPAPMPNSQPSGEESIWRAKKDRTLEELASLEKRLDEVMPFVKVCNRGGTVYQSQENGLRRHVSCDSLLSDADALEKRRDELVSYRDRGLSEECRRSGCLPGWLR